jgi:hypothetical protein
MRASDIAAGAPTWVYILLVFLVVLGWRRIKTRDVPVLAAIIPPTAFLIWSIFGAANFATSAGAGIAAAAWIGGAAIGIVSGFALPEKQGERLSDGRVRQPGSWLPLVLYVGVFIVRFACGAWAAVVPEQADTATALGIAVSAAVTGRLLTGVFRWKAVGPGTVTD